MSSHEINFSGVTTAAILAGRAFSDSRPAGEWERLCGAIDAFAARTELPIAVVVGTDLSSADEDGEVIASGIVGLLVAATDAPEPHAVDWDSLRTAIERAGSAPWSEIEALLGPSAEIEEDLLLWAAAAGPLAGFQVAFGVPANDESDQLGRSQGSPQSQEPELDFVAGKDMDQRPLKQGIWGVRVAANGDWATSALRLTPETHLQHVARLGKLAAKARYHLMSSYD